MSFALCSGGLPVTVAGRKPSLISRPQASRSLLSTGPRHLVQRGFQSVRAAADESSTTLSGEWPATLALASYEDVGQYFQDNVFNEDTPPGSLLQDIMSTDLSVTTPDSTLDELKAEFGAVSGLPVVKDRKSMVLVGVVSRKDLLKAGDKVADIMSTPPVAARPDSKVADAACLMLKHKVHRIPIVDYKTKVVGIVTRTDIFTALALGSGLSI